MFSTEHNDIVSSIISAEEGKSETDTYKEKTSVIGPMSNKEISTENILTSDHPGRLVEFIIECENEDFGIYVEIDNERLFDLTFEESKRISNNVRTVSAFTTDTHNVLAINDLSWSDSALIMVRGNNNTFSTVYGKYEELLVMDDV